MSKTSLASAHAIHVCQTALRSGVSDYARDFHEIVLAPEGYVLADPFDVIASMGDLRRGVRFHIQLGVFQYAERLAMSRLFDCGFRHVDATLHDPPFLTFPYFCFESRMMMRLSRGFDWYWGSFGIQRRAIEALERAFVLSENGEAQLRRVAPQAKTLVIPHIVRADTIWPSIEAVPSGLLYFGFIGPGKGLDYALELHERLLKTNPNLRLDVVGGSNDSAANRYVEGLRRRFTRNVIFHGYVPEIELDALFANAAHVILPYSPPRYVYPASGSVIQALRRARLVWTTPTKSMSEIIKDNYNGFMLSMDAASDAARLTEIDTDHDRVRAVSRAARASAIAMASYPYRKHFAL